MKATIRGLAALACLAGSLQADVSLLDSYLETNQGATEVAVTRPINNKFLVAVRGAGAGKLNLLAYSISGNTISPLGTDRRGKVEEVALIPHRLKGHFVVATKNGSGKLQVLSYTWPGGVPTEADAWTAGDASGISITSVKDTPSGEFVTAHVNPQGQLVLKGWRVNGSGVLSSVVTNAVDGGGAKSVCVSARRQGSSHVRIMTAKKGLGNHLVVISWAWDLATDELTRVGDNVVSSYPQPTLKAIAMGHRGDIPVLAARRGNDELWLQQWWNSGNCGPGDVGCFVRPVVSGLMNFASASPGSNLAVEAWGDGVIVAQRSNGRTALQSWTEVDNGFGGVSYLLDGEDVDSTNGLARVALGFAGDNVAGARAVTASRHGASELRLALWSVFPFGEGAMADPVDYCTAEPTEPCGRARVEARVAPSGAPNRDAAPGVTLSLGNVPGKSTGILLYTNARPRPMAPFAGGRWCLSSPVSRSRAVRASGTLGECDGSITLELRASWAGAGGAERSWTAQWWVKPPSGAAFLTDALEWSHP